MRAANLPTDRRRVLVILLAPWIYLITRDLYAGVHLHLQDLEYPAIVIAVWVLRPPLRKLALLGYLAALLALISVLMGVFLKAKGLYHASNGDLVPLDKKILPWGILVGPLTSENNLGQALVLGLPLIGLARSRLVKLVVILLTSYAIVWTASRSSIAALAVGGLIALALQVPGRKLRQVVAAVAVLATALVMIAIPVSTSVGTDFSNRGYIWITSLRAWSQHRVFGLGSRYYSSLAKYEEGLGGQAFHGHNTFVQMVAVGGAVGLILVATMAVVSLRVCGPLGRSRRERARGAARHILRVGDARVVIRVLRPRLPTGRDRAADGDGAFRAAAARRRAGGQLAAS